MHELQVRSTWPGSLVSPKRSAAVPLGTSRHLPARFASWGKEGFLTDLSKGGGWILQRVSKNTSHRWPNCTFRHLPMIVTPVSALSRRRKSRMRGLWQSPMPPCGCGLLACGLPMLQNQMMSSTVLTRPSRPASGAPSVNKITTLTPGHWHARTRRSIGPSSYSMQPYATNFHNPKRARPVPR